MEEQSRKGTGIIRIKKIIKLLSYIIIAAVILAGISIFLSQTILSKTYYTYYNKKIDFAIKVVQLTDLHNYEFGKKNENLIKAIALEKPDAIFMTGDMLNEYEERMDVLTDLIHNLKEIAPVYASLGNHEIYYMKLKEKPLIQKMKEAGATVLEQEYIDTVIGGQEVRLGGAYGYILGREYGDGSEQRFMRKFEATDRFKILLSHVPEGLLLWKGMERWKVDLVFSGHVHGGQMRLPFIGGLFDPEEGYFPTYTKGMFTCGNGTMILSAGLGSSNGIPRINNLPEIVVCEIKKEE